MKKERRISSLFFIQSRKRRMIFGEGKYFLGRCEENLRTKKRKIFGEEKYLFWRRRKRRRVKNYKRQNMFLEEKKNGKGRGERQNIF